MTVIRGDRPRDTKTGADAPDGIKVVAADQGSIAAEGR